MQRSACDDLGYELGQARLGHRAVTGGDLRDLRCVDVNSPDVVPVGGQTRCGHGADIAEADHCNSHRVTFISLLVAGSQARDW